MAEPEDQLVFEMAEGGRRFTKSLPAGEGEVVLAHILKSGERWIDAGNGMYLNSERVTTIELKLATDSERLARPVASI
jgi:hypothetical protein